jgi:hypothetical protein
MKRKTNDTTLLFRLSFVLFTCLFPIFSLLIAQQNEWQTDYERSGYLSTPRYEATMNYLLELDAASDSMTTGVFGHSAQGRELVFAIVDRDGLADPEAIRAEGRILMMVQACIHPGESEGKDAMLQLLRDLIIKQQHQGILDKVSIIFIPIFNADGHERYSPYGRINQNGPTEMGWRTTAVNLNLNRDFLKADAVEMKAWLQFYQRWQPEFFIDTHTTNGADYQYVLTYALETGGNMTAPLTRWQQQSYLPSMTRLMEDAGFPVFPYVSFRNWHDPRSGLVSGVASPMFSQGYTALRNRPGLLVETHMLKPYRQRVEATYAIILSTLGILNKEANTLSRLVTEADSYTASADFRKKAFPLRFSIDMTDSTKVDFKGVEYELMRSTITAGEWFRYHRDKPATFSLSLFDQAVVIDSVMLPEAYAVPVQWHEVIERLKLHGVRLHTLVNAIDVVALTDSFTSVEWFPQPYEGRHRIRKTASVTVRRKLHLPAGSVLVPMDQPLAPVVAHLLEPRGNGSLLEWGFFDAIFEQKEYAESYVMEPLAQQMLDSIPGLAEAFTALKASDPTFAASSWAQLNWFYKQTPWWDSQYMIYPVLKLESFKNLLPDNLQKGIVN